MTDPIDTIEAWILQVESLDTLDERVGAWKAIGMIERSLKTAKGDLEAAIHRDLAVLGGWNEPIETSHGRYKPCYGGGNGEKWAKDETWNAVVKTALENPMDPTTGEVLDPLTAVLTAVRRCIALGRPRVGALRQYQLDPELYRSFPDNSERPRSFHEA